MCCTDMLALVLCGQNKRFYIFKMGIFLDISLYIQCAIR